MNVEVRPRHFVDPAPFDPGRAEPLGAENEAVDRASSWRLTWWKFRKHRVAVAAGLAEFSTEEIGARLWHHLFEWSNGPGRDAQLIVVDHRPPAEVWGAVVAYAYVRLGAAACRPSSPP